MSRPEQGSQPRSAREISEYLEHRITSGDLRPGDSLPSVRVMARELAVSPATVTAAFKTLQSRGLTYSERGVGTLVRRLATVASNGALPAADWLIDVASGNPDPRLLPDLSAFLHRLQLPTQLYGMRPVHPEIAGLMQPVMSDVRGQATTAYSIAGGALDALDLAIASRLRPGDRVIVEDPGFAAATALLRSSGLEPLPVPVDSEGFQPDAFARALGQDARACLYSPRAQNPTGCSLSEARAADLRALLAKTGGVFVIENDHASQVAGAVYYSLTTEASAWIVVRSASKSHGPDLRFSFLAGDPLTISRVERKRMLGQGWISFVMQSLVAALFKDESIKELVQHAEKTYSQRRERLIRRLTEVGVPAFGRSGLNVYVPVSEEAAIIRKMSDRGWSVQSGEAYRINSGPFVRLTMAALSDEQIDRLGGDMGEAVNAAPIVTRAG